ncbi:hypothetical protein Patl1_13284 [Pistacia atlantica]|uniref:Uncharacterized protein n=1 Tax=Pistacia atlantica TaxID=434234 RepID=A0ACC1AWK5_9ROSI|nr:hypothetical protein Patl1_13284 [Pistacia atlantica]
MKFVFSFVSVLFNTKKISDWTLGKRDGYCCHDWTKLACLVEVKGVLHYGIAGNALTQLQIGDVTIPQYWASSYGQHVFWVPVDDHYFKIAKEIEALDLERCVNATTCLPRTPKVVTAEKGISGDVLLDNGAYLEFLYSKFNASPVDMKTAAVALLCCQQNMHFIGFRSLSDLAGEGSAQSNEAAIFAPLAAQNAVDALLQFIALLS